MSNHYPHQNRYVPSKLLPTHCYREHNEFGIPFKRYPLNFDEHEESGYYIDFNQTHLVYAVPCTDITFSKKYNRDDLKNETCDTTAETRDTVGTTAARYHNNTHSRHYPHCAHSSHVQGFDVLTITKLMDYELQLHDVTPERLAVLFENFACPQRDTVVFEHIWMEQHKFLSRYFKVHKKPLLDYCLFRFPEPPVCPGPGPTPGEGPEVLSVVAQDRYIDPETCVTYIDLLVTFTQNVTPTVADLKTIFASQIGETAAQILNAVQTGPNTMLVTTTFDSDEELYLDVDLTKVKNEEDISGIGIATVLVEIGEPSNALFISYEDHEFDSTNNITKVWLAFSTSGDNPPATQTEVAVAPSVNNETFIKEKSIITKYDTPTGTGWTFAADAINYVTHDGHACVEFVYNQDFSQFDEYEITFTVGAYLFKFENLLNYPEEMFVLQNSNRERVISNYSATQNQEGYYTGFWVIFPCTEDATLSVDLTKITRAPYDDLDNTVNPTAYNLGEYVTEGVVLPGRKVYITFASATNPDTPYTYYMQSEAIEDDTNHYNALWVTVFPNPEPPQPTQGPVLNASYSEYVKDAANPHLVHLVFDQDVELVNPNNMEIYYTTPNNWQDVSLLLESMSVNDFNGFIHDLNRVREDDTTGPTEPLEYYYDYIDPQDPGSASWELRHPDSGAAVWKDNPYVTPYFPNINRSQSDELSLVNRFMFSESGTQEGADYAIYCLDSDAHSNIISCAAAILNTLATHHSLTDAAEMLDGTHNTLVHSLAPDVDFMVDLYKGWENISSTEFQAQVKDFYTGDVSEEFPDETILITRAIIDTYADATGIYYEDLLRNTAYANDTKQLVLNTTRALIRIWLLMYACGDTYMLQELNWIINPTYRQNNHMTIRNFNNALPIQNVIFSTANDTVTLEFNEPDVENQELYIHVPINTVRNPNTGLVNRDGVAYTVFMSPNVYFVHAWGEYTQGSGINVNVNYSVPVNLLGTISDFVLTDGTHTATPLTAAIDPNMMQTVALLFDEAIASWVLGNNITLTVQAGALENVTDNRFVNDTNIISIYISGPTPPTPPATAPQLVSVSSTNNVGQDYSITLTFDQDVTAWDYTSFEVTDGVNTDAPSNYSVSGHNITLTFDTPYPTDWMSGTLTVNVNADLVRDSATTTVGNSSETLTNFVFGQAYSYPPVT